MSRIYVNSFDDWGCGYYRAKAPVYNCYSDLSKSGINLYLDKELHSDENSYDAYMLHRIPIESSLFFMQTMQKNGKKFILEMDDDILNIPEWMPSEEFKNPKWTLKKAIDSSDEIWVSTQKLADSLNKPEKTHVLPNLVDFNTWLAPYPPKVNPIRIVWMGSMWHDRDLEQIVEPVKRILREYHNKVQFLFWGCLPTAFADYVRIPGQNIAHLIQRKEYGHNLLYLEGIPFKFYFDRLVKISPCIGLAPLYDCPFNDSKSCLKYLEYTMAGAAVIASRSPAYDCIENEQDGLLVEPHNEDEWYKAIKQLIDNQTLRENLVVNARKKVYEQHSWQSQGKKQLWVDAFKRISQK